MYFYIDEAGTLSTSDNSRFFIISCSITDSPDDINHSLSALRQEITDSPVFALKLDKFSEQGFHACENHFDIRSRYYELLASLNFRSYFVVLDKSSKVYTDLISKHKSEYNVYCSLVYNLLYDRILIEKDNNILCIFEEYGDSKMSHLRAMKEVLEAITTKIKSKNVSIEVHSKDDLLLSIPDYMNYVVFKNLGDKVDTQMKEYFKIIEPKIGLVNVIGKHKYYSSNESINFDKIRSA